MNIVAVIPMAKTKEPKKREDKYEEKVLVKGTFEELLGVTLKGNKKKDNN